MYQVKLVEGYLEVARFEFGNIETAARFVEYALETYAGEKEIKAELTRIKEEVKQ